MASTVSSSTILHTAGRSVMYYTVGLMVQTFFFGVYTILIWMSTRMLLERTLRTRVNQVMFGITTFMYLLSAAYWAYSVADGVDRIHEYIDLAIDPFRATFAHTEVTKWSPLFNAVTLINYVLSDGVVIWRAWIICPRNHRKYLWITIVFLALTALAVGLTIACRVANFVISPIDNLPKGSMLARAVDVFQVAAMGTSLLSNLTATGVVGITAWGHWRALRSALSGGKTSTLRTNRILLLVVETGVFYCLSAIIMLFAMLIRLPHGTLGDLYTPVSFQIAGAYPTIVLLLVSTKKSLAESSFSDGEFSSSGLDSRGIPPASTDSKPIHFVRTPAMSGADNDTIMDISSSRPSFDTPGRQNRRVSDDSFV
ncbi:hypothetical protein DFH08DRAFT_208078 [Mycena albidolilacea]|uniref:Uncharacterized protein n=1 Tax=Mycena albidolilacea TaxID=1033008 RepID=A0AAD7EQ96_9AGAR|nr:hypothetical protein DFH08DRAFT_208078 [Mycena albidolilacea]